MADFETQQILRKTKKVHSLIALRKCDCIFSALFVNELFGGKCDSRSRENPLFLVRCSMFDFQFLAPPENLGCDFFRKYTDTQIRIRQCAKVFPSHTEFFLSAYLFYIMVISL